MKKLILLAAIYLLAGCDALTGSKPKPSSSEVSSTSPAPISSGSESETPGPTSSGLPTPSKMPDSTGSTATTPPAVAGGSRVAPGSPNNPLTQVPPPAVANNTAPVPGQNNKPNIAGNPKLPSPSQVMPPDLTRLPITSGGKDNGKGTKGENSPIAKPAAPQTIADGGIGAVKVGMTLSELKKNLKNTARFETRSNFASGYDALAVVQQGKVQFYIPYQKKKKITDADQVRFLVTDNPAYKTPDGVAPGMTIKQVSAVYGNARLALNPQTKVEEIVQFENQPAELRFFSSSSENSSRAGIYPKNPKNKETKEPIITDKYTDNGRIKRITILCSETVCGADQPSPG
jgi:hypothetical protein